MAHAIYTFPGGAPRAKLGPVTHRGSAIKGGHLRGLRRGVILDPLLRRAKIMSSPCPDRLETVPEHGVSPGTTTQNPTSSTLSNIFKPKKLGTLLWSHRLTIFATDRYTQLRFPGRGRRSGNKTPTGNCQLQEPGRLLVRPRHIPRNTLGTHGRPTSFN